MGYGRLANPPNPTNLLPCDAKCRLIESKKVRVNLFGRQGRGVLYQYLRLVNEVKLQKSWDLTHIQCESCHGLSITDLRFPGLIGSNVSG